MAVPVEIKSLYHDPDAYFEGYNLIIKYGYEVADDERNRDIKETFDLINNEDVPELRILAIGTGEGFIDEVILDVVSPRFKDVVYVAVDPAESVLNIFKEKTSSKKDQGQWQNVRFEFLCTTIEEYLEREDASQLKGKYHVIHTLHSAYHISDPHGIMLRLYGILDKGGMLYVMLVSGQWEQTYNKIGEYYFDRKMNYFGLGTVRRKFEEQIKDAKIITKSRPSSFRVNKCFEEDSDDGNCLLTFMTQIPNFRKAVPKKIADDILHVIKENCQRSGNDLMFGADDEDMVVIKP